MKISIHKTYKSIKAPQEFELPDFVVLTGRNGSGKSHLMEAMSSSIYGNISSGEKSYINVKYIGFNGLNPQVISDCRYMELTNQKKQEWNDLIQKINRYKKNHVDFATYINNYIANKINERKILSFWYNKTGGDFDKLTEDFFSDNYEISSNEMFASQFASIFKLYHIRLVDNKINKFLNETEGEHNKVYSDEEFEKVYGPKPWDLINKMLSNAHLSYRVNHPEGNNKELDFHLCLKDINTKTEIQVNDLSTGEKVLMSLALSIYNSKEELARPDVLLLDEPDAPLHPEYSRVLVSAIENSIVKEAGVKVVMSTHSPTTVAIAQEDSLYRMNKETCRPEKITKQQAVNILVQDLDNIRLSFENRRQVFVESKYDTQYYKRLFGLVSQKFDLPTLPQFLPPRSSEGANCDEVSEIVNALRGYGNDLVYGIKDFDNKNHSSQYVLVLGENKRYAIDNYIFDPIYVAYLLIRENIIKAEDVGLPPFTYVDLSKLNDNQIQILINYILGRLGLLSANEIDYKTLGGKCYKITQDYCTIQGHELESKIISTWPNLNSITRGGGDNKLKNHVLDTVCKEYPDFISMDFVDLFNKIV